MERQKHRRAKGPSMRSEKASQPSTDPEGEENITHASSSEPTSEPSGTLEDLLFQDEYHEVITCL